MALLKSGTRIYGNATIDTNLSIDGTTVSSDYQTGALVVSGGVGIAGNVFINANLNAKDTIIVGNLTVTGTTTSVNSTTTQLEDPVIDLGAGANGATLTTNDGLARGLALHYFNAGAKEAFVGWDTANSQFAFGSDVSETTGVLTINTYGNVKADSFLGNLVGTGNLTQLTVNGITRLGNLGNVKITGGTPDYLLQTDGQGNLVWVSPASALSGVSGNANISGSNTQVFFNDNGSNTLGSSANLTFDSSTKTLTVDNIVSSTIIQNASSYDTRVSLSSAAGIIEITSNGSSTQFLPSGAVRLPAIGAIYSGTFDGSQLALLNNDSKLSQLRSGNVKLEVGSSGSVTNTWVFAQNGNTIFPATGNVNLGNVVTSNYFKGDGGLLSNIVGANVTGVVANATYSVNAGNAYSVSGSNVSGQVGNALVAGTVYTNAQPNITSVGTLTDLTVSGNVSANTFVGNLVGSNLIPNSNITYNLGNSTNRWKDLYLSGTSIHLGEANLSSTNSDLVVNNGNIQANYFVGDGSKLTNISVSAEATRPYITSNIDTLVAGSTISVVADYTNSQYPGGVFTIEQLGPVTLNTTDTWVTGSSTKNAYANYVASTINTQNVNISLSLSNATFSVQSSDTITIGTSTITGANLLALNITGNGTYTIPNTYFSSSVQTTTTSAVTVSLTTSRGKYNSNGTTLTSTQPVAFSLNALTGSFPSSTVPYFNINQSFNWSTSITGTASAGNITYSGGAISSTSLTSSGQTSGTSGSIDSTYSYTLTTSDLYGLGLYGYGNRTIPSTVTGTIAAATKYYPLFYKITNSRTVPEFTTSDSYLTHNYVTGDGATTSATTSQYLWIAIPGVSSHTFAYTFLGSQVGQDPAATNSQTISGYSYTIYGFTNFSVATFLYTVI